MNLQFPITPEQFQQVRRAFSAKGVSVPDEAYGEIEQHGIKCRFTYDGITLRITLISKPWYLTEDRVSSGLTEFIENATSV